MATTSSTVHRIHSNRCNSIATLKYLRSSPFSWQICTETTMRRRWLSARAMSVPARHGAVRARQAAVIRRPSMHRQRRHRAVLIQTRPPRGEEAQLGERGGKHHACVCSRGVWKALRADSEPLSLSTCKSYAYGGVTFPGILFMTWRAQGVMNGWLLVFLFKMCCHKAS